MKKVFFLAIFLLIFAPGLVLAIDSDNDGLTDEQEAIYHTNPNDVDTDSDWYTDGEEIKNGFSPLVAGKRMSEVDTDVDNLIDELEIKFGTDLTKKDTDEDGFSDFEEIMTGHDPLSTDKQVKFDQLIEIDKTTQHLYYFVNKIKVLDYPISTGVLSMQTPSGNFKIINKVLVKHYKGVGFDFPNTKWNLEFKKGMFIHSAYWHNDFGKKPRSHGCVNMRIKDAELLYKYIRVGVPVLVIGTTPRFKVVNK